MSQVKGSGREMATLATSGTRAARAIRAKRFMCTRLPPNNELFEEASGGLSGTVLLSASRAVHPPPYTLCLNKNFLHKRLDSGFRYFYGFSNIDFPRFVIDFSSISLIFSSIPFAEI